MCVCVCVCLCVCVCVFVCVCVCGCVWVGVGVGGWVGDRCAANRSGIRKVENLVFALVTSLVMLVNHKPLGK